MPLQRRGRCMFAEHVQTRTAPVFYCHAADGLSQPQRTTLSYADELWTTNSSLEPSGEYSTEPQDCIAAAGFRGRYALHPTALHGCDEPLHVVAMCKAMFSLSSSCISGRPRRLNRLRPRMLRSICGSGETKAGAAGFRSNQGQVSINSKPDRCRFQHSRFKARLRTAVPVDLFRSNVFPQF